MVEAMEAGTGKAYLRTASCGLDSEVGRGEKWVRETWKQGALIGFPVSLSTSGRHLGGSSMFTHKRRLETPSVEAVLV